MSEELFKRKNYSSWDEAFRGLAPVIRQQSVRVASYTQVLYVQGCGASLGKSFPESAERMKRKYADFAYKCGLYHQLGKAVYPAEYQVCNISFSEEEMAVYRKYPIEGKELVTALQEPKKKVFGRKKGNSEDKPSENITWLMLREVCEQHMERYDGSGYPYGLSRNDISIVAQIVGLAKELDRIATETVSETPFEIAFESLVNEAGKSFSHELIEVLKAAKDKCEDVFNKYIYYSKAIVKTIPLVEKRPERPMGVKYFQVKDDVKVIDFEAVPWFKGILDRPNDSEGVEKLEKMLIKTGSITDVYFYFLYEVTDTLLRMKNCKIETAGVMLQMPVGFYLGHSKRTKLDQVFADQPIEKSQLKLSVPEKALFSEDVQVRENLEKYIKKGYCLVLDDYHPGSVPVADLLDIGFKYIRVASDVVFDQNLIDHKSELEGQGILFVNQCDEKTALSEEDIITNGLSNL